MKISLDKTYKTKDGRAVRIYDLDCGDKGYPIAGSINNRGVFQRLYTWTPEGCFVLGENNSEDLVECLPRHTVWINIYGKNGWITGPYESKEAADKQASHSVRTACTQITYEEGEGL